MDKFLKIKEVANRTAICRARIYQLMKLKQFPQSVKLGKRSVAWVESEINAWIEEKIQERSQKEKAA